MAQLVDGFFFLGCVGSQACAISPADDPWEFCARLSSITSACFDSLQAAEEWIRQEPTTPNGRRFLEPTGAVELVGAADNPSWIRYHYAVKPKPPRIHAENYISALNMAPTFGGVGCGCINGPTPHCVEFGSFNGCFRTPQMCYGCNLEGGDISPLRQAMEDYFSSTRGRCGAIIKNETEYPDPANSVNRSARFNGVDFNQWTGALIYDNDFAQNSNDPRQPFSKTVDVLY